MTVEGISKKTKTYGEYEGKQNNKKMFMNEYAYVNIRSYM